jgi:hypothetical protein
MSETLCIILDCCGIKNINNEFLNPIETGEQFVDMVLEQRTMDHLNLDFPLILHFYKYIYWSILLTVQRIHVYYFFNTC